MVGSAILIPTVCRAWRGWTGRNRFVLRQPDVHLAVRHEQQRAVPRAAAAAALLLALPLTALASGPVPLQQLIDPP